MTEPKSKRIIIEGVTNTGAVFRPADWAERMSGTLSTFRNHRIRYSPLLQPIVNQNGTKCVLLDPALQHTNLSLYNSILEFARANNLKICQESEGDAASDE